MMSSFRAPKSLCVTVARSSGVVAASRPPTSTASSFRARPFSYSLQSVRAQSSDSQVNARPSYQIYGENVVFTIKSIPPEFRAVSGGKTIVLDGSKKGRLLLEWTPRAPSTEGAFNNKFAWDRPLRFGLSPEEIGLVVARLKCGQSVELNRQLRPEGGMSYDDDNMGSIMKVFRAEPLPSGSIRMACDYEMDGRGGQNAPNANESRGPLGIELLVGESQVIQSIMEYSIPRLTGWSTMLDQSMEYAFRGSSVPNPHNYNSGGPGGAGRDDGVPF